MFQNREIPQLREHTYELAYNRSCQLVGQNQYTEAEKKLKLSEKLCRESLEEDATGEEEIEDELGIIKYVTCDYSVSVEYAPLKISAVSYCASFHLTILMTVITKLRVYETETYQRLGCLLNYCSFC
jgi:signal recognition particle subunit SRP72